jgi:antitoxin VapB
MKTLKETRVFMNGSSQAVRIPKDFRFGCDVVYLKKVPGGVLMVPKERRFEAMRDSLSDFTGDFMEERNQGALEKRAELEPLTATKNH